MKKRGRIILSVSVILILLLSFVDLNLTSSTFSSTKITKDETAKWNDNLDERLKAFDVNTLNYASNTVKWESVVDSSSALTKKFKNDTIKYDTKIKIRFVIDELHVGLGRYIPYYKPVDYNSSIIYEWFAVVSKNKTNSLLKNKGLFTIDGHTNISGICSTSNAKKIIENNIRQIIQNTVQKEIDNQIKIVQ